MVDHLKDRRSSDRRDGKPAQYEIEAQALREKTERLRALRIARDGIETATPAKAVRVARKTTTRRNGASSETLAAWLKTQEDQGRRS
jgi:hypothetical protein